MFSEGFVFRPVYTMPAIGFNEAALNELLAYGYTMLFGEEFKMTYILALLAAVLIVMNLLSNLFRYLSGYTVESMRANTIQQMRNQMFDNIIGMNVGYFSDQRKGDIISRITSDVSVVQFCITNTLQVAFREPFLIIGYLVLMLNISWELALFSVLFLPVVGLIIGSIVKKLRHPASQSMQRTGEMIAPSSLSSFIALSTSLRSKPLSSAILPAFIGSPASTIVANTLSFAFIILKFY
jgi:subfamily B ATP-binding cassette protein MsbA